jgi:formylglycine-generating enzyme required for sulfatase activity
MRAQAGLVFGAMVVLTACAARTDSETDDKDDADLVGTTVAPLVGGPNASCTGTGAGLTTCGAGAESCCTALPLGNGVSLDKFQVTAGRMRAFIVATSGNVKGWYTSAKATLRPDAVAQIDPYVGYLPTNRTGYPNGAYDQLGGFIYLPSMPSTEQGCWIGNATDPGYGSHTYPLPTGTDGETRGLTSGQLAAKALNCVSYPLAAAFCAWDGGRLQTKAEHDAAWGTSTYPWGTSPIPGGWEDVNGVWTKVSSATGQPCPTCDGKRANWMFSYQHPLAPLNGAEWDFAIYVGEPGRATGRGPKGHADIAGNLMELTATFEGTATTIDWDGRTVTQPKVHWTKNGSWEGHPIGYDGWAFPIMTKYGKTGLRCAR